MRRRKVIVIKHVSKPETVAFLDMANVQVTVFCCAAFISCTLPGCSVAQCQEDVLGTLIGVSLSTIQFGL